ncbi:MAG: hypothetical protein ACQEWV_12875 [Bacillota bacterium]
MTNFVTNGSVTARPKVKSKVVMNAESLARTEPHNNEVNERNHVVEAQKQISSQETVGVPPQE